MPQFQSVTGPAKPLPREPQSPFAMADKAATSLAVRSLVRLGGLICLLVLASSCERKTEVAPREVQAGARPEVSDNPFPWQTYDAEDGSTSGTVHGPQHRYPAPECEASGRRYVRLDKAGDYVEFSARELANTLVIRYCTPDAPQGGGRESSLDLIVNGEFRQKIALSSRHAWIYGDFPWSNDPKEGKAHHFFDEVQAKTGDIRPGDVVRLQSNSEKPDDYCLVDFIELENAPLPLERPAGSLSITDFGAVADDGINDTPALMACIEAARQGGQVIWIPPGDYMLAGPRIKLGGVQIHGAGMWHSKLTGPGTMFDGTGEKVRVSDLAIFGEVDRRIDNLPENAFDGNFGDGSVFEGLWIEHLKCGFWTTSDTRNMRVVGCRIRNIMADGLNYCGGTSYSTVERCHLRNTGDDALATWSPTEGGAQKACVGNKFIGNWIQFPWLANGLAIYGGSDHEIIGNRVEGSVFSGSGLLISSGFKAIPFSGTIVAKDNVFKDTGGDCYIGQTVGSLWIHALHSDIEIPLEIDGLTIERARGDAITVHGPKTAKDIRLRGVSIDGASGSAIHIYPSTSGKMDVRGLQAAGYQAQLLRNDSPETFEVVLEESTAQK